MTFFPEGTDLDRGRLFGTTGSTPAAGSSPFLEDLVKIATAASRAQAGDFIWIGHQPHGHEPRESTRVSARLGFGSQGIMLTPRAAQSIIIAFQSGFSQFAAGHVDTRLKRWVSEARRLGSAACFLWPPLGSYTEHVTECAPEYFSTGQTRPSLWSCKWSCPGTRPTHDPQGRPKRLIAFTAAGFQETVATLPASAFETTGLHWRTFLDPPAAGPGDAATTDRATQRAKRQARNHQTRLKLRNYAESAGEAFMSWTNLAPMVDARLKRVILHRAWSGKQPPNRRQPRRSCPTRAGGPQEQSAGGFCHHATKYSFL
jgi:hypothetical protein